MPRLRSRSASSGVSSWLLAPPATTRQRSPAIERSLRTPPTAQGDNTSHSVASASSGATVWTPLALRRFKRAGSTSVAMTVESASIRSSMSRPPTPPAPWTSTVRLLTSSEPNA